jgi:hypothetical protein
MTAGKFVVRTFVVALAMFTLGFVGHQLLLGRAYVAIEPIMRSKADMQSHMPFALVSCICFSGAFVWIYSQLRTSALWLTQGARFGVAVWTIASVPLYLTNYVIEPWPGGFVLKILVWELLAATVLGILTAALAKGDAMAATGLHQLSPAAELRGVDATPSRRKA